ncbi:bifunctional UDP-N-acetylglucosamine diphosphorylase/glucosamine-1-phosphate N-acetyltransferase GlmU [Coprothermobacter platensis]|uniref:bifunctional UDP-N-acetylglucosamine diphosphorylase/glucosamine-1-phosphate N-acetyltransferase GlmU n=1 Tax=Coprothermobacter platensis TaxID=108819 RepID=UPI00037ED567|nr:bifunctional UDP-N-acetylglucosamine diphosphorylase/glucosamine-1-phosphate N-acetyltransferase GlmU [Coprothermobacter platensis]
MYSAVILAGGVGKRFNSKTPKIMHRLGEKPIIYHSLETLKALGDVNEVIVVTSPQIAKLLPEDIKIVIQEEPLGTAHAAFLGAQSAINDSLLIVNADIPLVSKETFESFISSPSLRSIGVTRFPFESDFGRVRFADGLLRQIVEFSDLEGQRDKDIPFVNTGVYKALKQDILEIFPLLRTENAKKEYYITDMFNMLAQKQGVSILMFNDWEQFLGINTRHDLAKVFAVYKERILERVMEQATVIDPNTTFIGERVSIGQDTVIYPNTTILGETIIGQNCSIGPNVEIKDSKVGDDCEIKFSVVEEATIDNDVSVGPFGRVRPGAHLCDGAKIGNFVEIKNSSIGKHTKVNHLSYIGDAQVGEDTNIGAGTITCNYDGYTKNRTVIGDRVFIGSDTILVAPVELEDDVFTAAGSVITDKIPRYSLGIGRARQLNKDGWVKEYRRKKEMK